RGDVESSARLPARRAAGALRRDADARTRRPPGDRRRARGRARADRDPRRPDRSRLARERRRARGAADCRKLSRPADPHRGPQHRADRLNARPSVEDYTNKYKGEQVEIALFGGEYQDGVLTAYCYVEDVAHIELNGHILIPPQNIASLHCSSRCDAPEPDWPPHGLAEDDADERDDEAWRVDAAGRRLLERLEGVVAVRRACARHGRARLEARRLPARPAVPGLGRPA